MSQLVEFVDPKDSTGVLILDNGTVINSVPSIKDNRDGIGFNIPTGSPNGNGARLTITRAGRITVDNRGILFTTEPYARLDIDDFYLQLKDIKPELHANERLVSRGWNIFGESTGLRYTHKQATNYLLFEKFLLGQDISGLLYDGFNGYNVTISMVVVPQQVGLPILIPSNFANFWSQVQPFCQYFLDKDKRLELTGLCDMGQIGWSHQQQVDFVNQLYDLVRPFPNVMFQLGNEVANQPIDIKNFNQPSGIFWSRGSSTAGDPCPLPAGNYSDAHLSRNLDSTGLYLDAQPYPMCRGYDGYVGTNGPVITNETRGASNTEESSRRSTDPEYFRRIAAASKGWGGMTFHSDYGIHSDVFQSGTIQDACRLAFLDGIS